MWRHCKGPSINFKNYLTNLKIILNFRLSLSSWGPIKVGARGNFPPPLSAALCRQTDVYAQISSRMKFRQYACENDQWCEIYDCSIPYDIIDYSGLVVVSTKLFIGFFYFKDHEKLYLPYCVDIFVRHKVSSVRHQLFGTWHFVKHRWKLIFRLAHNLTWQYSSIYTRTCG
jgi:hypothetical protein